jgi:hypothetical protein
MNDVAFLMGLIGFSEGSLDHPLANIGPLRIEASGLSVIKICPGNAALMLDKHPQLMSGESFR